MTFALLSIAAFLILLVFHSYVIFPIIVRLKARNNKENQLLFDLQDRLPKVYIIMAVYNEEKVIEQKLKSLLNSSYPLDLINIIIGSDASNDRTDEIIKTFQLNNSCIQLTRFGGRTGKSGIVNQLIEQNIDLKERKSNEIFILTDANVIFTPDTIFNLCKHFKNNEIAIVGANILNLGMQKDGISFQEKAYISRENNIKYWEGKAWGTMMGAFGACYAIRADYFCSIPANYLMEDFYISMAALKNGGKLILEKEAICYEDVSNDVKEEFKRKIRISAGNYQNLSVFYKLLLPSHGAIAFTFLSHKVLRWFTPFIMILLLIINIILAVNNKFYLYLLLLHIFVYALPFVDSLFKKINLHFKLLRLISYFILMNLALFLGFFRFIKGIKTSVWQPTKRNT